MSAFTDAELEYLRSQRLARVATATPSGNPEVSPVGFSADPDGITTSGFDITKTLRYRNILANGRIALVVDDLASVDPWKVRGVKVRGTAEVVTDGEGRASIRVTPEKVSSWGLD